MKMQSEHYQHILEAVKPLAGLIKAHREVLKSDPRVKDLEMRLRWDLFWAAKLSQFASDTLYTYLNDAHIDTALKKIMTEVEPI